MKEKFASFLWGTVKFAIAGILTWAIPTFIFIWNGKDDARAFISEAVAPEIARIEAKHDSDIELIGAKLTPIASDVTIIKECLMSGCHGRRK